MPSGYELLRTRVPRLKAADLIKDDFILFYELSRWLAMWPKVGAVLAECESETKAGTLTLVGYSHFRLGQAFGALARDDWKSAEEAVTELLALERVIDPYLLAGARFCKGLALRFKASYTEALKEMTKARDYYVDCAPRIAAVADLQLHWFYQQSLFHFEEAEAILDRAEGSFAKTSDGINQAYVQYLRGRTLRFKGLYELGAERFAESVSLYKVESKERGGHPHGIIVRALAGQARCLRLLAQKLEMDSRRRDALREEAKRLLVEAQGLTKLLKSSFHDRARIRIGRAQIDIDSQHLTDAHKEADRLAEESAGQENMVILARVNLLNFRIAQKLVLQEASQKNIQRLIDSADAAVKCAANTEHRRIKARALIARGNARVVNRDLEGARRDWIEAAQSLLDSDKDYLREEFDALESLLKAPPDDPMLKITYRRLAHRQLSKWIKDEFLPEYVKNTRPFYRSKRHMRDETGLSQATIDKYWID